MKINSTFDYIVIGGGFYGCCLALFLRSISGRIALVEAGGGLLTRASRVNQARVHSGFHYPRSVMTAVKSRVLHHRFVNEFPDAIDKSYQMLYAIARRRSKVSAKQFYRMYSLMGAPIAQANPSQAALFNFDAIESVFSCTEYAFNYAVLRDHLASRIEGCDIKLRLNSEVQQIEERANGVVVRLSSGDELFARFVFNVTYSQINNVLRTGNLSEAELKHELAEIALIRPPNQMKGYGVTIMDGPFLSAMPYPSENLYSLTHVKYTPHHSWTDRETNRSAYSIFESLNYATHYRHMILDGQRYIPSMKEAEHVKSIYEVKTVLLKNESNDGRPILYHRQQPNSRVISIMGAKIDNIYDLFDLVKQSQPEWGGAHDAFVTSNQIASHNF